MVKDSTPLTETPEATPPESTPAGTGTPTPEGAPETQMFKDDKERAEHFESRHKEATETIRKKSEETKAERESREKAEAKLAKYNEMYGELDEDEPTPPPQTVEAVKREEFDLFKLQQSLPPNLREYTEEVQKLTSAGVTIERAKKIVAEDHNITLGPSKDIIDAMPTDTGGGSAPEQSFTAEELEALNRDRISLELAKKHLPALEKVWKKALKR